MNVAVLCLTPSMPDHHLYNEAVGLAPKGKGGTWVEEMYHRTGREGSFRPGDFPVNTHGGLLAFGAPWETPAMYNIIEAIEQLTGEAGDRQVPNARRALVYGNGGIFSHSAVAILGRPVDDAFRHRHAE